MISETRASECSSPLTIVNKRLSLDSAQFKLNFGAHVKVHEKNILTTSNNTTIGTLSIILGKSYCRKQGQCFVSLVTRLKL